MRGTSDRRGPGRAEVYALFLLATAAWAVSSLWVRDALQAQVRATALVELQAASLRPPVQGLGRDIRNLKSRVERDSEKISQFVDERLGELERQVNYQTALISNVIGEVVPVELPPDWEASLTQLESQVAEPTSWPETAEQSNGFLEQLTEVIATTPFWAEDMVLDRLTRLRWASQSFALLRHELTADSYLADIDAYLSDLDEIQQLAPKDADANLLQAIADRRDAVAAESPERILELSMAEAKAVLDQEPANVDRRALLSTEAWLERAAGESPDSKDVIDPILRQLQVLGAKAEGLQRIPEIEARLAHLQSTAADEPMVRAQGIRLLLAEAGSLRANLALQGTSLEQLETVHEELEGLSEAAQEELNQLQSDREANALTAYRACALSRIRNADYRYGQATRAAARRTTVYGQKWTKREYDIVREAMEQLLEVDPRFLDWVLSSLYQDTLQAGYKILKQDDSDLATQARKDLTTNAVGIQQMPLYGSGCGTSTSRP